MLVDLRNFFFLVKGPKIKCPFFIFMKRSKKSFSTLTNLIITKLCQINTALVLTSTIDIGLNLVLFFTRQKKMLNEWGQKNLFKKKHQKNQFFKDICT